MLINWLDNHWDSAVLVVIHKVLDLDQLVAGVESTMGRGGNYVYNPFNSQTKPRGFHHVHVLLKLPRIYASTSVGHILA